jgi:predicted HTH transcriptional regulator
MISNLISNPESKTLEFKRDLSSPRSVLRTLVAFANSAGGHLILGVADDRKIIGVENPLDEEERLSNLIADSVSPRLVPSIEMITVEEKICSWWKFSLVACGHIFLKRKANKAAPMSGWDRPIASPILS